MSDQDPLATWPTFVGAVETRLEQGRTVYADRSQIGNGVGNGPKIRLSSSQKVES
jgi:hypothetical protein